MAQPTSLPRASRRCWRSPWLAAALLACGAAHAAGSTGGVQVEVRGVGDDLKENVLAYLSFQRYQKGGAELNEETVERLHNRVEREVDDALRPFGYYAPEVESTVTATGRDEWKVVININPGEPVVIRKLDVKVAGPGADSPLFQRIVQRMPLKVGERLNHAQYEAVKADLQRTAATYGFLDAKLVRNELVVDPPNHTAEIALELETGARYRFGTTTIEQHVVRDELVRRYLRYKRGDYYDVTQVLRTQFALDDSQYFVNLEVKPGEPDRDALTVPITIRADPSRRFRYSAGAGYATDTGPRGTLGFEDRHINSLGHSLSVQVQASAVQKYAVQSRYRIPVGDPALENVALNAIVEQQTLADVTAITQSAGPSVTEVWGRWQTLAKANAVRTTSSTVNGSDTQRLIVPELDLARLPAGYLGEPLWERPFYVEIKGSHAGLGSDSNWVQLHALAERVFPLAPKWHLLLRDEFGMTVASNFNQLPAIYRFFAGGDNSVRGFTYNDLSPLEAVCATNQAGQQLKNANGTCAQVANYIKVGGKDVVTGTVEVIRDLPRSLAIGTFIDYGNALNGFSKPPCLPGAPGSPPVCTPFLQYSVGVGLLVRLPVMTLGIDIAQPLSATSSPRLHINFAPKL